LQEEGYSQPTEIQEQAIPHLLAGEDLLGIAQTGTGKTAAFALPILQTLLTDNIRTERKRPKVLILAPTRELAGQIRDEIGKYGRHTNISHTCIFGGVGANPQIKTMARGVDILVATPGRLLDLTGQRHVDLSGVTHLVLDEADRLLDMGFIRDIRRIVSQLPKKRQSLLFSATMPSEVAVLAREMLNNPLRIDVSPKKMTVQKIDQHVIDVDNSDKQRVLEHLLRDDSVTRAIVFTRTKHGANKVSRKLENAGICAQAIHGNKSQNARQRALDSFKNGDSWVLVATDIAARGIDIDGISHVINFELPHEPESYVHRIGRTARAGASGVAWSLVDPSEKKRLRAVERLTKIKPALMVLDLPAVKSVDSDGGDNHRQGQRGSQGNRAEQDSRRGNYKGSGNSNASGSANGRRRNRRSRSRKVA
jgi:ATP-dependent RNA helicase RhlE